MFNNFPHLQVIGIQDRFNFNKFNALVCENLKQVFESEKCIRIMNAFKSINHDSRIAIRVLDSFSKAFFKYFFAKVKELLFIDFSPLFIQFGCFFSSLFLQIFSVLFYLVSFLFFFIQLLLC
jgi:hypothetical protein